MRGQDVSVSTLAVPKRLAANAGRPEAAAYEWFGRLPEMVEQLVDRWGLRLGPPFQPGGVCSWVAPATDRSGRDVVLKLSWRHPETAGEAAALIAWSGRGAVQLYDLYDSVTADDGLLPANSDAVLLERCRPGTPLGAATPEVEQDAVVARLLCRLRETPPPSAMPSLATMCDAWATEYETAYAGLEEPALPADLVAEGLALMRSLSRDADDQVLLCTDCHAENIVAAGREPWLMIDPNPHVGDPTYDVLQHLLNCRDRLVAEPRWLVDRMADLLDVDRERARLWLFARSVQESIEMPWLVDVALAMRPA